MFDYDVTIVGGGPGGSAAAISCAQEGLRVTLIERETFPRDHAGETLHPGVEVLLEQLGVLDATLAADFLRHEGHWVQWGETREFKPFGKDQHGAWRGFQAWRADFDAILLDRARGAGVTILQPCRALQPLIKGGHVAGVVTSRGAISSTFVVDAAGGGHWLARRLGLHLERRSRRLLAYYGYVEGDGTPYDGAPAILADQDGWTWLARVRSRVYQWTRLSVQQLKLPDYQQWLPADVGALQPRGRARGADVTWRLVSASAGEGYFLVGDAAAVLDPTSSHGVLKAMMTGMMAGHLIKRVLNREVDALHAAEHYCRWVCRWFAHDSDKLREFYAALPLQI